MKKNDFINYRLLAAVCFALQGVYRIYIYLDLTIEDYAFAGIHIGLALTLLWGQKAVLLCVTILSAIYNSYSWFLSVYEEMASNSHSHFLLHVASLFYALSFAALAVALIMAAKNDKHICSFWFFPAAFSLVFTAIYIYLFDYFFPVQYGLEMQWLLPEILHDAIEACGFAFAGFWLKEGASRSINAAVEAGSEADAGTSLSTDSER